MRTIQVLAVVALFSTAIPALFAQESDFDSPCFHNLDPVVPEQPTSVDPPAIDLPSVGAPTAPTLPSVAPENDPRDPGDLRRFEDARSERSSSSVDLSVSRWAGLPGADDEVSLQAPKDPRKDAVERLVRKQAEARAAWEDCELARRALGDYRLRSLVGDDSGEFVRLSNDVRLLEGIAIAATEAAEKAKLEAAGIQGAEEEDDGTRYQVWYKPSKQSPWEKWGSPTSRGKAEKEVREAKGQFPQYQFKIEEAE